MPRRLRRVSATSPGWTRRAAGRGFSYRDIDGTRLAPDQVARIKALAIPPAWTDVWICPVENGHLQATGVDDAGRRQYLYHPQWRILRDQEKFDRIRTASRRLPRLRRAVQADLGQEGIPHERACALAVRLLDLGCFRIGNDVYADEHGSFGLTTLRREHVRTRSGRLVFTFPGKSGVEHSVVVEDELVAAGLLALRRRRGTERLFGYREEGRWSDLTSEHVNAYLAGHLGGEFTAKDFRTWHATVLASLAVAGSEEPGATAASRARAVRAAVQEVAAYLGNTVAVARNSYIDPRVWDRYEEGTTIPVPRTQDPARLQERVERSVRRLLRD